MDDLIRRRDAVSRMSDLLMIELQGQRLPTWNEVYQAMNDVPSAEPERKWIPVTEALPINDVDVIVSVLDDSGDTPYRFTSVGWCTPNGQYWVVDNEMCYGVIAWQPLPEPWRGE